MDKGIDRAHLHRLVDLLPEQRLNAAAQLLGDICPECAQIDEQLAALERNRSEFVAQMSHELRIPLNSIMGFTEVMLLGMAGPLRPEQERQLGLVLSSARHLLDLLNDMLNLSRIESGRLSLEAAPFDLPMLIRECIDSVHAEVARKSLAVTVDGLDKIPAMQGDRQKVKQVFLNVLTNAVKFTERGSVRVVTRCDDDDVWVSVQDTGRGIPPHGLPVLFQPFQRVDPDHAHPEGTGLGLYLSRKLLDVLGGEIWVEHTEYGRGSTFTFRVPRALTPRPATL